jgi:hypothetical protein
MAEEERIAKEENIKVVPFHWNGGLIPTKIVDAAGNLAKLMVETMMDNETVVVTLRFGGVLANIASRLIHESLFLADVPIDFRDTMAQVFVEILTGEVKDFFEQQQSSPRISETDTDIIRGSIAKKLKETEFNATKILNNHGISNQQKHIVAMFQFTPPLVENVLLPSSHVIEQIYILAPKTYEIRSLREYQRFYNTPQKSIHQLDLFTRASEKAEWQNPEYAELPTAGMTTFNVIRKLLKMMPMIHKNPLNGQRVAAAFTNPLDATPFVGRLSPLPDHNPTNAQTIGNNARGQRQVLVRCRP